MSETRASLSYALRVHLEPAAHYLEVTARIQNPPSATFFLNRDMDVKGVHADGEPIAFHRDPTISAIEDVDTAVVVEADTPRELTISYEGTIEPGSLPPMIDWVSAIKPDHVELALYAGWYPRFPDQGLFDVQLEVDLPSAFIVTTSAAREDRQEREGRTITRWRSSAPGFDIAVVGAPSLQTAGSTGDGGSVEIFYSKLPEDYVATMQQDLARGMQRLAEFYGPLPETPAVRLVYAPRDGWGYVRGPLIIVAEQNALDQMKEPFGQANDFRYAAHETAHFWWSIADMSTPDDWINEGLAEFSSVRLAEEFFGEAFAEKCLKDYRYNAAHSQTETPIAETAHSSPDREVNRYGKTTLLFLEAQRRFGADKLDRFLRSLLARFGGKGGATTERFLEMAEEELGEEARAFFEQGLYAETWPPEGLEL